MSQVPFVKYIDPRLNLNQKQQYVSAESASLITTSLRSVNGDVGSSITINCNPPNRNICVSREVYKRAEFEVELEVKNLSGNATTVATNLNAYTHAPAYMPISRITLNEDITIGNANVNQANAPIVRETTSRFQDDSHFSGSANMNDTYLSFADVDKSVRSALAPYFDATTTAGTQGNVVSRNAFWNYNGNDGKVVPAYANDAVQNVKVKFTVEEPLMLSPFVFGKDAKNATSLIGIESIQYNCSFGNYEKCFSFLNVASGTASIQKVVTAKLLNFGLRFTYLTPQPDYDIPRSMMYPYYEPQVRTEKVNANVASGDDIDNNTLTIQLSGIPRRMYVCMRDLADKGDKPLRHLQLKEGTFTLKINGQNTLTGQTNKQLYDTASKNGYNLSYSQWEKYCGSIICLDFGKGDVSLLPLQVAGVNQKNEFEISASYKNQTSDIVNCQFTVIYIYDGVFRMVEGATNKLINTLTEKSVQDTKSITKLHIDHSPDNVYGGGMGGGLNLKGVSRDVADVVSKCVNENMGAGLENTGGRLMSRGMLRNRY